METYDELLERLANLENELVEQMKLVDILVAALREKGVDLDELMKGR